MGRPAKVPKSLDINDMLDLTNVSEDVQKQLMQTVEEIKRIHNEDDLSLINTNLKLAGAQQRYWDLRALISVEVNEQLACSRQSASWAEQQVRAAKSLQIDLLRELFAKAEAMEKHSSALKSLE